MKLPEINIIDEYNKKIRTISKDAKLPLSLERRQQIKDICQYLKMSQIKEYEEKYDLRPGMGLAFIQIGIPERIFVIVDEVEDGKFENYVIINPKIISESEEMIYVGEGEGCLSVNRPVEGIVPRHARLKLEAYDEDGNLYTIRVREDISVAFQHEIDHLNGILFTDHIDPKNPFKNKDIMREI